MLFEPTSLLGSFVVRPEPRQDERGYFARAFCRDEFAAKGLETNFVQANTSGNRTAGTIRGMHFQRAPHAEVKLVRAIAGRVFDVIVDMRPDSSTYLKWFGLELSAERGDAMYVPHGFAHGYQALTDGAQVFYLVSAAYFPGAEGGLRPTDPTLAIAWPLACSAISPKDASWPLIVGESK